MNVTKTVNATPFVLDKIMNTPRMTEAWARSSRTADGFYSTATPMSVYARSCYEEGCKLEHALAAVTEQRDRLAEALRSIKNELGVPQPEYPAPVANAVKIADEALQSLTPNEL